MTGKKLVYICCCFLGLPRSSGFKLSGSGFQIATPGRGMGGGSKGCLTSSRTKADGGKPKTFVPARV